MLLLLHPHAAPLHLSLPLSKSRMLMMPRIFVSSEHVCPLETEMVLSSRKLKMLMCPQCRDKAVLWNRPCQGARSCAADSGKAPLLWSDKNYLIDPDFIMLSLYSQLISGYGNPWQWTAITGGLLTSTAGYQKSAHTPGLRTGILCNAPTYRVLLGTFPSAAEKNETKFCMGHLDSWMSGTASCALKLANMNMRSDHNPCISTQIWVCYEKVEAAQPFWCSSKLTRQGL